MLFFLYESGINNTLTIDLIANKRVSRRGVFPFRFRGSCRLEPCLDGEVAPEIVQSAGGFFGVEHPVLP